MATELERFDLAQFRGRIAYEHLHRYALCRDRVAGKRVLDLACGTGYGTALLAQAAADVTGVDISFDAIRTAKARYGQSGAKYLSADCYDLPFENGSFDVVIANEMIEHVENHDGLIAEARRVLVDGGLFLVSTPNKPVYNRYKQPNIFHVSEMDVSEFRRLLSRHFREVHFTGTRMALVSVGFDLDGGATARNLAAAKIYHGQVDDAAVPAIDNGELWLNDAEYVLAACSDAPVEAAASASSLYYAREDDLWLEHEKVMAWASQLHEEDEVLRADVVRTREDLESSREAIARTEQEKSALAERIEDLRSATTTIGTALDLQRESIGRELGQHFDVMSRLLRQTTGSDVGADAPSLIEAMFRLGDTLATQRVQLADLDAMRGRVAEAERQGAELRRTAEDALRAQAHAEQDTALFKDKLAEIMRQADQERSRFEQAAQSAQAKFSADLAAAELRISQGEEEMRQAIQQLSEKHASELARVKASHTAKVQGDTAPAASSSELQAEHAAARKRFVAAHRRVHAGLALASQSIHGRIPPTDPVKVGGVAALKRKLGLPVALFRTAAFDAGWVEKQVPGLAGITLARFVSDSQWHHIAPHPLFDAAGYLSRYPDVAQSGASPLQHYCMHGWREGRQPHPLFANDWYLHQNPDVMRAWSGSPLDHYLELGWKEGRWPNPVFDPRAYLDRYRDVDEAGAEPLTHFAAFGQFEGREAQFRSADTNWQRFVPASSRNRSLVEYFLTETPENGPDGDAAAPAPRAGTGTWPPQPLNDYWPPQTLRDFVIDGYGEDALSLYWYLYSVMAQYADKPEEFAGSEAFAALVGRASTLAKARAATTGARPDASVIIPVYNNILDTLLCMVSLLEQDTDHSFEIIVADDGSTDATATIIPAIGGMVRYVRQPRNLGFLGNCNEAAKVAAGRFVVLLNNDTLVLPGWLNGLLAPFATHDNVGLTGSKLINWDGSLQEAGGIFWRDGSAWNFGRDQNARAPEFSYLKDTDYCSGAAIAIPTDIWRNLGGFDPAYTPAYCEDSDLAFRLREAGYRTLFSPESEVVHHEGRSHGRDLSSGIKAYQVANQQRLLDRWRTVLERDHYPNAENVLRARDRSFDKRHILIVDHYVPQFDRDAGSRTMFDFVRTLLNDGWAVTFWPDNLWRDPHYTPQLQRMGVEVIYGPAFRDGFADFIRNRQDLYDAVLLSRPHIAKDYVEAVRTHSRAKLVYYGHDIHFRRMAAQAELEGKDVNAPDIQAMQDLELSVCNGSDVVMYPSQDEAAVMAGLVGARTQSVAIPAYRYLDGNLAAAENRVRNAPRREGMARLLFVGGFAHQPNVDGIIWFCREIAPILRASGFSFQLDVVGSNANEGIMALGADDINVIGFVSDETLQALYEDADLVIAPLRFGAGVKGKVVEAMAYGVPVVTTDVGAQGIDPSGEILFLGNEPAAFARMVQAAAQRPAATDRALAAIAFVKEHYSQQAMSRTFESIFG